MSLPRKIADGLRLVPAGIVLGMLLCCASAPEPKPEEPEQGSKLEADSEEVLAPLNEADRKDAGEEVASGVDGQAADGSKAEAGPDEFELGQEASSLLAAAVQVAQDDPGQAIALLDQAAAKHARCFQCHYNKAVLLEAQVKFGDAETEYRKALAIRAAHVESVINLSNMLLRAFKVRDAQDVVTRAIVAAPKKLSLRNQLIAVLIAGNKLKEALEQAKGVLQVDERNVDAMIHLAQVYRLRSKFELAERILLKAREIDKANPVVHNRLGFVYLDMESDAAAIASFKKAVDLEPRYEEGHNNLGVLYSRANDFSSAAEHFRKAVAAAPRFVEAYLNLGNALRGDLQFKEAEDAYKKVLELAPGRKEALYNLGLLYLDDDVPGYEKSQRYGLAEEYLTKYRSTGGRHESLDEYIEVAAKKKEGSLQAEERKRKRDAEKASKAEEEAKRKAAEEEAKRKAAEEEAKRKAVEEEAKRMAAEEEAKRKAAEEEARRKAAEERPSPAGKLSGSKDLEEDPSPSGKLGGDEK